MTTYTNNSEGGSNGTTISTGNSGGASGDAWASVGIAATGTLTFDNTHARGTLAAKVVQGGTSGITQVFRTFPGSSATLASRFYLYLTAAPGGNIRVASVGPAASICARLKIGTDGKLALEDAALSTVIQQSGTFPLNQWFRVELQITLSATVGQATLARYDTADSATPTETATTAATQNFNGVTDRIRYGSTTSISNIGPFWIDDIAENDTGAALGVSVAAVAATASTASGAALAPTATAGASVTATAASATATALAPTVVGGASVTAVTATASGAALSPAGIGGASVTAAASTATAETLVPTVTGGALVEAVTATLTTFTFLTPTVMGGAAVTVDAGSASADALAPTFAAGGSVTAGTSTATAAALAPTVAGGVIVLSPVAGATCTASAPAVVGGATVIDLTATATATALAPSFVGQRVAAIRATLRATDSHHLTGGVTVAERRTVTATEHMTRLEGDDA